ncbi:MAG: 3-dehydroquinate synthase [Erysipelotrichia bacterium]|nr:3-dehydroquinate synthase [Erysipelotrichia bacterium]
MSIHTNQRDSDILLEHGILNHVRSLAGEVGSVFLVSDDGVPEEYRRCIIDQYPDAVSFVFPQGEASKNADNWQRGLGIMLEHHFSRNDTVIALGGGVVGDLAGFIASTYMRGVRFINIPTTVLSQIDSSIGGKTAIDMNGIKNCAGAFWQPAMVLIDPDTLKTLPARQIQNGLAEAVKEGMTSDPDLFEIFEQDDYQDHMDEIIERCLNIKKAIVEHDERESGERRILNFGHTYGHAYESIGHGRYLHGECVAMGMMTMMENGQVKERLQKVLQRLNLPIACDVDPRETALLIQNDKKADHDHVTVVRVTEIGRGFAENWTMEQIRKGLGL